MYNNPYKKGFNKDYCDVWDKSLELGCDYGGVYSFMLYRSGVCVWGNKDSIKKLIQYLYKKGFKQYIKYLDGIVSEKEEEHIYRFKYGTESKNYSSITIY